MCWGCPNRYHGLDGSNHRNVSCDSAGDRKSEIKVSAHWFVLSAGRDGSDPGLSGGLVDGRPLHVSLHIVSPQRTSICVQTSSSHRAPVHIRLRPVLTTVF